MICIGLEKKFFLFMNGIDIGYSWVDDVNNFSEIYYSVVDG